MALEDVLLALTTYPEPTPLSTIDDAVGFAIAIGARISAVACEVRTPAPGSLLANVLLDIPSMIATEAKKSSENADRLLGAFQASAEKHGVFQDRIADRCLNAELRDVLVGYARLHDLTIVPVPEVNFLDQWSAESIIFGSGRPTVILPADQKRGSGFALDTVVVAWDFGRSAARAVADALPILQKAKHVRVMTVTNEKAIDTRRSGAELAKHLARHHVDVVLDSIDAAGRTIGDALNSYVASHHADLLVMGAYGHSRLRDFVLGGATKSMLSHPSLPVFLSH